MAPKIPEFILRKMFLKDSLRIVGDGFAFDIKDTYAPATVQAFALERDGEPIPPEKILLQLAEGPEIQAADLSPEEPLALPVDRLLHVTVQGHGLGEGRLRLDVRTREVGTLSFGVHADAAPAQAAGYPRGSIFQRVFRGTLRAELVVNLEDVIGEINPHIYGHFVEHLENCVYGGVFTPEGAALDPDVLDLVKAIRPGNIRYPGGNFASDYHWEEGIGPRESRPVHVDRAWHVEDPNWVGTDAFLAFCQAVGADPYLVINDGSGTPEEAARWVSYCNGPVDSSEGARRARNGHPAPYGVRLWGLGNEVWGEWQIGHTDAAGYVRRIGPFINAMREADPTIQLVAVGLDHLAGDPRDAEGWNRTVLEGIGEKIDALSFHLYQPSEEGYRESYDPESLYHSLVSAPHSVEDAIRRMADTIHSVCPDREIAVALDEYNVKLPPPPGARSMHDLTYTLRDGLYVAGMLNAFHRQCNHLQVANIAMLVNVLPVIVNPPEKSAFPTPLYFPFLLYRHMEDQALAVSHWSPTFKAEGLGLNISEKDQVPYIDVTATRSADANRVVVGVTNRHPLKPAKLMAYLKGAKKKRYRATGAWLMSGPGPLAANTADEPEVVGVRPAAPPRLRFAWMDLALPPASLLVVVLEKDRE